MRWVVVKFGGLVADSGENPIQRTTTFTSIAHFILVLLDCYIIHPMIYQVIRGAWNWSDVSVCCLFLQYSILSRTLDFPRTAE